ncbi:MAG: glycosyltransferase [Prevotellaceae bacterium]|jgi:glycosyltransferase involved in cell wall biosynthesis|nr:glycosyltransferase [Prevotellaceae bacterium]
MKPVFSIITVTYNAEATIERTVQSVLKQDYPHIEYIIIDGKSDDNTMSIVERYRHGIAKTVSEKDGGIYYAMNKGLALATGDYLWFLNAGDTIYSENAVSQIVSALERQNLPDVIYGETAIVDISGKFLYMRRLKSPDKLTWKNFKTGMMVCHQSFIVKRTVAPEYDLRYKYSSDYDWCIRCLKCAAKIYNSRLILTNYLNVGETSRNMKKSLKERFLIMCNYYGCISVCLRHLFFAVRFIAARIKRKI